MFLYTALICLGEACLVSVFVCLYSTRSARSCTVDNVSHATLLECSFMVRSKHNMRHSVFPRFALLHEQLPKSAA